MTTTIAPQVIASRASFAFGIALSCSIVFVGAIIWFRQPGSSIDHLALIDVSAQGTSLGRWEEPDGSTTLGAYMSVRNLMERSVWLSGDTAAPTYELREHVDGEWVSRVTYVGAPADRMTKWTELRPGETLTWLVPVNGNGDSVELSVLACLKRPGDLSETRWIAGGRFDLVHRGDMVFLYRVRESPPRGTKTPPAGNPLQ
jgi:hypothetical protein